MRWIKHDTDANQDAKLQNVLLDYGLEGYGLYWYCIELIAGKVNKESITFELEHDARIIARNTGSTPQKVEEMMRYFVDLGLFESSEGVITCMKLARRLDSSMTSNPEMRKIISKLKSHDPIMTESETIMQDKIRLEENKDNGRSNDQPYPSDLVGRAFEHFWQVWKDAKKDIGKTDTSPKGKTKTDKWNKLFNTAYFKKHSEDEFKAEVTKICEFVVTAHNLEGFNRFHNMQCGKFFSEKQWRDE